MLLSSVALALAPTAAVLVAASTSAADAATAPPAISIVHRYLPPSAAANAPLPAWTPRLAIHLDGPAAAGKPATVSRIEDLLNKEPTLLGDGELDAGWYQVALEGSESFTSVRACLHGLPAAAKQEVFTLHPAPDEPNQIYHVDYALAGIARDGACPDRPAAAGGTKGEIVVRLARSESPTPLILGAPPPVDAATGMPAEPVPEKSFIQKYWVYFAIPIGLLLMLPEEAPAAPAGK